MTLIKVVFMISQPEKIVFWSLEYIIPNLDNIQDDHSMYYSADNGMTWLRYDQGICTLDHMWM